MRDTGIRKWICVALVAFLGLACVDRPQSNTGSAGLYVFDGGSHAVMAWNDVSAIFDAGTAGAADRTITSTAKIGPAFTLGLGGMVLDSFQQNLYLVAATGGRVVRINRAGAQTGELTSSLDIISFSIDDAGTDVVSGTATFGQASVDTSTNTLFVTESDGTNSQIWVIPLGSIQDGSTVAKTAGTGVVVATLIGNTKLSPGTHDSGCTGVTTSNSGVTFAYFNGGDSLNQNGNPSNLPAFAVAARLRKGSASGFDLFDNVILGQADSATTLLAQFGCLAYDTSADRVYAACQNGTATTLVAFDSRQFSTSGPIELAPVFAFGGPPDLRIIAHAGQKDWVVGASPAGSVIQLWKGPSTGVESRVPVSLGGVQVLGLALDGSN